MNKEQQIKELDKIITENIKALEIMVDDYEQENEIQKLHDDTLALLMKKKELLGK